MGGARKLGPVAVRRLRRISAADRTWMATEMRCAWNAVKERAAHDDSAASMESARPRAMCAEGAGARAACSKHQCHRSYCSFPCALLRAQQQKKLNCTHGLIQFTWESSYCRDTASYGSGARGRKKITCP